MRRLLLLLACFVLVCAPAGSAQAPSGTIGPRSARLVWERPRSDAAARREPLGGFLGPGDRDHRYEGFFVGAGLGLVATMITFSMCQEYDGGCETSNVLLLGPIVSGVVGLSGAVLGGFLPKS